MGGREPQRGGGGGVVAWACGGGECISCSTLTTGISPGAAGASTDRRRDVERAQRAAVWASAHLLLPGEARILRGVEEARMLRGRIRRPLLPRAKGLLSPLKPLPLVLLHPSGLDTGLGRRPGPTRSLLGKLGPRPLGACHPQMNRLTPTRPLKLSLPTRLISQALLPTLELVTGVRLRKVACEGGKGGQR